MPAADDMSDSRVTRDGLIGRTLAGRYKIVSRIATGGMGKVYRAEQQALDRIVALKILSSPEPDGHMEQDGDPGPAEDFRSRFVREASICAKLTHPNTVRIFDYGHTEDDIYFIVMEHVDGVTLRRLLRHEKRLDPGRVARITLQVCSAVSEAHESGIIHRDLKPSNILITRRGEDLEFVKVVDFGLVRPIHQQDDIVTQTGHIVGSPRYMSPEQAQGLPLTPESDVYSIGVMMYEALCGRAPFSDPSSIALLVAHVQKQVPPMRQEGSDPHIPEALEWAVMQCLKKHPGRRFSSALELRRALKFCSAAVDGHLSEDQLSAHLTVRNGAFHGPPGWEDDLSSTSRRSGSLVSTATRSPRRLPHSWILGLAGLAAVVAVALAWWQLGLEAPAPPVTTSAIVDRPVDRVLAPEERTQSEPTVAAPPQLERSPTPTTGHAAASPHRPAVTPPPAEPEDSESWSNEAAEIRDPWDR